MTMCGAPSARCCSAMLQLDTIRKYDSPRRREARDQIEAPAENEYCSAHTRRHVDTPCTAVKVQIRRRDAGTITETASRHFLCSAQTKRNVDPVTATERVEDCEHSKVAGIRLGHSRSLCEYNINQKACRSLLKHISIRTERFLWPQGFPSATG